MQLSYSIPAFITLIALSVLTNAQNQFNSPNELACIGQKVEMTCYIQSPTAEDFVGFLPYISFNNSKPYGQDAIDSNSIPGIDTSRYSIQYLAVGLPRLACTIIISSYQPQDGATLFGCHGRYFNGTETIALASGNAPQPVLPPSKISNLYTIVEAITSFCIAEVSISFDPPHSASSIKNYMLYLNGEFDQTLDPKSSYITTYLAVAPATTYKLTIASVNCGGTSEMSEYDTISIPSYSLDNNLDFSLDYFNNLVIKWSLTLANAEAISIPIPIGYKLKVDTAFTEGELSSILNQSYNFEQTSSNPSYSFDLGLSIIGEKKISLDTIVTLTITSQCDDKGFAGNSATARKTGLKSNVQLINIPYNISWIVVAALIILSAVCALSNVVLVLYTLNEYSKKRGVRRRNDYLNRVAQEGGETREPLLNPPSYTVNTAESL